MNSETDFTEEGYPALAPWQVLAFLIFERDYAAEVAELATRPAPVFDAGPDPFADDEGEVA